MSTSPEQYAIGVDYGTNGVRAVVVETGSGSEVAEATHDYAGGDAGVICDRVDPNLARQHPGDYISGFRDVVAAAVRRAAEVPGFSSDKVVGLGVDTTGSTPMPVDRFGNALGMSSQYSTNPAAQAWLWKDHTSFAEAEEITDKARRSGAPYLEKCGGTYSSEWYWSKLLRFVRTNPDLAEATASWVELADFIPGYLTGNMSPDRLPRSICAAGHKAMYHTSWGGLPSRDFLESLHPGLSRFRYETRALPSNRSAGGLLPEVAQAVGLPAGIPVAIGAFDAHMGAVGAGCRSGTLVKIMGTSTCDCIAAPLDLDLPDIPGVCGIVPESILPGMYGIEAGQSAVGDLFNWFVQRLTPEEYTRDGDAHARLTAAASRLSPGASGLLALDWNNGNRTILVDARLTGLLIGQTLHTTAPEIYRCLIEATAFGALTIIRRMEEYAVEVREVVNCGGIAARNPLVMQIYADVCNRPMRISRSDQTCALGAAIFGAVVGGAYDSVEAAQAKMTGTKPDAFTPDPRSAAIYAELYNLYRRLHDAFSTDGGEGVQRVMKDLLDLRDRTRRNSTPS
ncbi:MAG TPA: ribulokinase [Phycisphaerae bacterium]|nr:ribulokinase [Phycisphaerae bacterium]HRW55728.1 ribulokinase [Phycisphaerae bacterium]